MRDAEKDAIEMSARRVRLLEAGFRLMSARTIEAVKLSEIANEAGIGIATLYRYFKTKAALVIEIGTVLWNKYYVEVFATKFHTVYRKAKKDGTLYTFVSVAGKFAEGLVYPPDGEHDMTEELLMLKRMIVDSMRNAPNCPQKGPTL